MKKSAVLINTSRGKVINEASLIRALQSNNICGAYLDVFENEPINVNNPLLDMNNVILNPHNSNSSKKAWDNVHRSTIDNLFLGLFNE